MKKTMSTIFYAILWWAISFVVFFVITVLLESFGDTVQLIMFLATLVCPVVIAIIKARNKIRKTQTDKIYTIPTPGRPLSQICKLEHVGGLPLPSGMICKIAYSTEEIKFTANGQDFLLPASKLIDVSVMSKQEIQKQYVSSIGGAVAGGILLGPLGAIIGGSAKVKQIKNNHKFLILTYQSDDETKYILLDATKNPTDVLTFKLMYRNLKRHGNLKVNL